MLSLRDALPILDWGVCAEAMKARAPVAIGTMGQNGARIHETLAPLARTAGFALEGATDLADAIGKARAALAGEGVVLLSPGAPSFGPYRDYTERGGTSPGWQADRKSVV